MAGQNLARKFFRAHHADLDGCLNTNEVIPGLNSAGLITLDEYEELNLKETRKNKIGYLVQIMSTKGPTAPGLFVECVRNASDHLPHSELADKMTRWIQSNGQHTDTPTNRTEEHVNSNRSHQDSAACNLQSRAQAGSRSSSHSLPTINVNVHVHTNPPPFGTTPNTSVSVTQTNEHHSTSSPAQPIPKQASGRETEDQPPNNMGFPIQEQSNYQPFSLPTQGHQTQSRSSESQTLPSHSSATFEPAVQESSSPSHSQATQRHNSGSIPLYRNTPSRFEVGLLSAMDQLSQMVPSYTEMVQTLASKLSEKGISIGTVVDQLNSLLHNSHIDVAISVEEVRDFPSLCLNLRNCGLCHEVDVDLLCKLFSEDADLHSVVKRYAENNMDNGASPFENGSSSSQTHYLLLTFHNKTEMNIGQVFQVKDFIAGLLQIRRHTFTLAATRPGSTVLVWRIPTAFHKQATTVLESEKAKLTLHKDRSLQKVELEHMEGGQVFVREVYSKAEQLFDRSISSTTDNDDKDESTTFSTDKRRPSQAEGDIPTSTQLRPCAPTPPELPTAPRSVGEKDSQESRGVKRRAQLSTDLPLSRRPRSSSDQHHHITIEASPTSAEDTIQSRPHPPADTRLQVLAGNLTATYTSLKFFTRSAAPRPKDLQFINLALIMKQKVSKADSEKDQFLQSTLHGSIDDIVKKKKEIKELKKIFDYGTKGKRKLVLVEGAPGVGKTMLALKLCQDWAEGKLLDEYSLVFLVPLRRFQGKPSVEVQDIINISLQGTLGEQATQALFQSKGEKALIILEGWDELPPELREEGSFFFDLINGNKLPKASILVTSRPSVTADLYDYMDERHIEVLGFNSEQIVEYVKCHGKDMADTIIGHLNKFPNLKALAHIPLTLAIVCNVASKEATLPHTLTELYDRFICNTLLENLKRKQPVKAFKSLIGLSSLEGLPGEVRTVIDSLCALALDGFKEKKFVYSQKDLKGVGIEVEARKAFDGFGLLNTPINAAVAGFEQVFQFNHLSIQEFLAAYGIQQLEYEDRVVLLREYRMDKQFRNIWKFFAGITRLEDEDFKEIVIGETGKANRDQIFLFHCLYEANNRTMNAAAAQNMFHVVNLNNMFLSTTDCLCVAHVIASAGGEWNVDLRGCNIGEEGLQIFKTSMMSYLKEHGFSNFKIVNLILVQNRLSVAAISNVVDMLSSELFQLEGLNLSSNTFGDAGIKVLSGALQNNSTIQTLHFSRCEFTSSGAIEFASVLEKNKTIKELHFQLDPIGDNGVMRIAKALEKNESLIEISLTGVNMTAVGLAALTKMTEHNSTLQILRIERNLIQARDSTLVASMIEKNNSLTHIDAIFNSLSKSTIGNEGFKTILEALIAKPSSSVQKLAVYGCGITPEGLPKVVELFSVTKTFANIQLGCNEIGDEGAEVLSEALLHNVSKSVKSLVLEMARVSHKGKQKLQETCDLVNTDRPEEDKVKVTYTNHAHLVKIRDTALHI